MDSVRLLPWFPAAPGPEPCPEVDGTVDDVAERLVRRFLALCENPRTRARALALVKGSVRGGRSGRRFYGFVNRSVVHPVARVTGVRTSAVRCELVASQLVGLAMMRYVLEVEPIASLDVDELVALTAPAVRAVLGGSPAALAATG
jgi:hypothetical protein